MAGVTDPNVAASGPLGSGFNYKTYRILQNVRHGSNTGGQTNTTTWTDTDAVINFRHSKTLSYGRWWIGERHPLGHERLAREQGFRA